MDNTTSSKKILVSGYTYVDESTLKTFDYYPGVIKKKKAKKEKYATNRRTICSGVIF